MYVHVWNGSVPDLGLCNRIFVDLGMVLGEERSWIGSSRWMEVLVHGASTYRYSAHGSQGLLEGKVPRKHDAFFLPTPSRLFLLNATYPSHLLCTVVEKHREDVEPITLGMVLGDMGIYLFAPPAWAHQRGYATDHPGAELKQIQLNIGAPMP